MQVALVNAVSWSRRGTDSQGAAGWTAAVELELELDSNPGQRSKMQCRINLFYVHG